MKIYSESRLADKKKIQLFDSGNEKEKTRQPTMAKTFIASKSWLRRLAGPSVIIRHQTQHLNKRSDSTFQHLPQQHPKCVTNENTELKTNPWLLSNK